MQSETNSIVLFLAPFVVLAVLAAVWLAGAYNDLARRRSRIIHLWAVVKSTRSRRRGVARALASHVGTAVRHEQAVAREGSRRGGAGGRVVRAGDIANGWPGAAAVGSAERAMAVDVQSHDLETGAWRELYAEAEAYNASIASFPRLLVAPLMGFRPWRCSPPGRAGHGRRPACAPGGRRGRGR